jgi:hypothetical protein
LQLKSVLRHAVLLLQLRGSLLFARLTLIEMLPILHQPLLLLLNKLLLVLL